MKPLKKAVKLTNPSTTYVSNNPLALEITLVTDAAPFTTPSII